MHVGSFHRQSQKKYNQMLRQENMHPRQQKCVTAPKIKNDDGIREEFSKLYFDFAVKYRKQL
jgi:hypothetical protein